MMKSVFRLVPLFMVSLVVACSGRFEDRISGSGETQAIELYPVDDDSTAVHTQVESNDGVYDIVRYSKAIGLTNIQAKVENDQYVVRANLNFKGQDEGPVELVGDAKAGNSVLVPKDSRLQDKFKAKLTCTSGDDSCSSYFIDFFAKEGQTFYVDQYVNNATSTSSEQKAQDQTAAAPELESSPSASAQTSATAQKSSTTPAPTPTLPNVPILKAGPTPTLPSIPVIKAVPPAPKAPPVTIQVMKPAPAPAPVQPAISDKNIPSRNPIPKSAQNSAPIVKVPQGVPTAVPKPPPVPPATSKPVAKAPAPTAPVAPAKNMTPPPTTTTTTTSTTTSSTTTSSTTTSTAVKKAQPAPAVSVATTSDDDDEQEEDLPEAPLGRYVGTSDQEIVTLFEGPNVGPLKPVIEPVTNVEIPQTLEPQQPVKPTQPKTPAPQKPAPKAPTPAPQKPAQPETQEQMGTPDAPQTMNQAINSPANGRLQNATNLLDLIQDENYPLKIMWPEKKRYYSTQAMASFLKKIGDFAQTMIPNYKLVLSDVSTQHGGAIITNGKKGHQGHQNGNDADISYLVSDSNRTLTKLVRTVDGRQRVSNFLEVKEQWALMKAAYKTGQVMVIFMDPSIKYMLCKEAEKEGDLKNSADRGIGYETLRRIYPLSGHANHFHVRVKCGAGDATCQNQNWKYGDSGCSF